MTPDQIAEIRAVLPATTGFDYTPDLESPWLLAAQMPPQARIADLRSGPLAPLLSRPLLRSVVANCGDGVLRRADVAATADPFGSLPPTAAGAAGQAAAWAQPWRCHILSFTDWGVDRAQWGAQLSRRGGNLVLQISLPTDHAALFAQYLPQTERKRFESSGHPVRTTGLPTMAWVRLDVCMETGEALIEEVQSDWFRYVRWRLHAAAKRAPRSRSLRNLQLYDAQMRDRYARDWERVALLSALVLLRREFAVRRVFLHQPQTGYVLKRIWGAAPPVSLYTKLPRSFGFALTSEAPAFLERPRHRDLRKLRRTGVPLFWLLEL